MNTTATFYILLFPSFYLILLLLYSLLLSLYPFACFSLCSHSFSPSISVSSLTAYFSLSYLLLLFHLPVFVSICSLHLFVSTFFQFVYLSICVDICLLFPCHSFSLFLSLCRPFPLCHFTYPILHLYQLAI